MYGCCVLKHRKSPLDLFMTFETERQLIQKTHLTAASPLKMSHRKNTPGVVKLTHDT